MRERMAGYVLMVKRVIQNFTSNDKSVTFSLNNDIY